MGCPASACSLSYQALLFPLLLVMHQETPNLPKPAHFLKISLYLLVYLRGSQRRQEFPFTDSLCKCLQWLGLDCMYIKPKSRQEPNYISHHHCLPGCMLAASWTHSQEPKLDSCRPSLGRCGHLGCKSVDGRKLYIFSLPL